MTVELKNLNEKDAVKNYFDGVDENKITVIKVGASWCGSCVTYAGKFLELNQELGDKAEFLEADADLCPVLSMNHNIRSVPTLLVFKGKERITKFTNPLKDHKQIRSDLIIMTGDSA